MLKILTKTVFNVNIKCFLLCLHILKLICFKLFITIPCTYLALCFYLKYNFVIATIIVSSFTHRYNLQIVGKRETIERKKCHCRH